jgi:hypothetical protein
MSADSEGRPAVTVPASRSLSSNPIVSETTDDWQEIADHIDGAFVVLLRTPSGRRHRRCFLTLKAVEHAADLALARGQSVEVVLAELKPLFRVRPVELWEAS